MRDALRRLEQHQALGGQGPVEPAARDVVDERPVVEQRVVPAQRKLEAGPARLRAVARPLIAADLSQDGDDFADEIDRLRRGVGDVNVNLGLEPGGGDDDLGVPFRLRDDKAVAVDGDVRRESS